MQRVRLPPAANSSAPSPQIELEFQLRAAAVDLPHGVEDGIHPAFLDLTDMSHELAKSAFGEFALLEPHEVFLRQIVDGHTPGRVFLLPEHSERHVGKVNFSEKVSEIFAVDFGEVHIVKRDACGAV